MTTQLQEIVSSLKSFRPNNRTEMIGLISGLLATRLCEIIKTPHTASVVFVIQVNAQKYVLKAECNAVDATNREISWYREKPEMSPAPKVIHTFMSKNFSFLIIDYISDAITLDDIVASPRYTDQDFLDYVDQSFKKCQLLFEYNSPRIVSRSEADTFLMHKFDVRTEKSEQYPYLRNLFQTDMLTVNGKEFRTPRFYVEMIRKNRKLYEYLTPDRIGMCHGDLHFGNILIHDDGVSFIDPNSAAFMPIEYDFGRLLHSAHGRYAQIMNERFSLKYGPRGTYEFSVDAPHRLDLAMQYFKIKLTEHEYLRAMYTEALHFATMLINHVANQNETTALFIRDVQLFDELFESNTIKALI